MQDKPVALVTGANQGIGLQIAKDLAAHGFTPLFPHVNPGQLYLIEINTDWWKSYVHSRLQTPAGQPGGLTLFHASPTEPEIHIAEIDPTVADDKKSGPLNDVIADRRTDFFLL